MPDKSIQLKHFSGQWTDEHLRHLSRRVFFGIPEKDSGFLKGKNLDECVELILTPSPLPSPPVYNDNNEQDVEKGKSFVFAPENKSQEKKRLIFLRGWWLGNMLTGRKSITEKMVMFWHNHFAVEFNTVGDPRYNYHYLNILRKNATGNFKHLLREITTDPCMLVYLNGNLNNNAAPNENYARELQELFAIGKGPDSHYTEGDVKAAAKILSGWKDDKKNIDSYFDPAFHNNDDKVFSTFYNNHKIAGRSGADGAKETDDLIEMICSNHEVPKFLCRKLYRWFVHSNIDDRVEKEVISPLADIMFRAKYEVIPVLKAMFTGEFFYDPNLVGSIFKSPVDYMVGIVQQFQKNFPDLAKKEFGEWYNVLKPLSKMVSFLGQNAGDPPGVAGWPAYYEYPSFDKLWINSELLSMRNKVTRLISYPQQAEQALQLDFIQFANRLPNPGNDHALLTDSLSLLCCIQPGTGQIAYMQKLLNAEQSAGQKWDGLWSSYQGNPSSVELQNEVTTRLQRIYVLIFMLPEFQIM